MKNCTKYIYRNSTLLVLFICLFSCSNDNKQEELVDITKVALRDVGHKLLLFNQDSTSLVKPIITLDNSKFQLSFEEDVSIHPDTLVNTIKNSFKKAGLSEYYLTEVEQCENEEVAYSYEIKQNIENNIIPCGGRQLPKACYVINVRFTKSLHKSTNKNYFYVLLLLTLLVLVFLLHKRKSKPLTISKNEGYAEIGSYQFYPNQSKLVKKATEISLSKKECELLEILVANSNQVVKRDELEKRVWEDNGVVVGRSLDTYISKLRKKLQDDDSIKITNVHGIGYKLEVL
ncbi:MAG: winged helix-turn-helix domain-containing protein [Flavobacteriaceae bacterium]